MTWGMAAPPVAADPLIVSHRGNTVNLPENTLAAFAWSVRIGADYIELDLRQTADGRIVIMHDARVDRTTNGRGRVHRLSFADLRALDAGGGQRVPTLEEAFDLVRGHDTRLLLDVKDPRRIDPAFLASSIRHHGMMGRVLVGSRSAAFLAGVKTTEPEIGLLGFVPEPEQIDAFAALDVDVIRVWPEWTQRNPALVGRIRSSGSAVWMNAGARLDEQMRLWLPSVDGVITDRPVAFLAAPSLAAARTDSSP